MAYAPAIADGLRNLRADGQLITELEQGSIAYAEGLLPYWAVAQFLRLYRPPTDRVLDFGWTQFHTAEDWAILDGFLGAALKHAPKGSQFMHNLLTTILSNVRKLQEGQFEPSKSPQFRDEPEDDIDDEFYDESDDQPTPTPNPVLADVVQKLQHMQAES